MLRVAGVTTAVTTACSLRCLEIYGRCLAQCEALSSGSPMILVAWAVGSVVSSWWPTFVGRGRGSDGTYAGLD